MRLGRHDSGVAMWVTVTTAGVVAAAWLARRARSPRTMRVVEPITELQPDEEDFLDATLDDSFPASDPPSWSPVSGIRSR